MKTAFLSSVVALLATALFLTTRGAGADDNWPQFRGPGARGISDHPGLPDRWSATENVAWKTDLPGRGWSSPVVWGDRVFLTTAISSGDAEAPKQGLYLGGERPTPEAEHEWKVFCLALDDGSVLWERTVHRGKPATSIHLKNSYASETPVTDGQRVYAYFGNIGLFALDFQGELVWSKRFEPRETREGWGTAASPAIWGDRIYVVNDNEEQSYLVAIDKHSGEEAWRVDRDEKSNWSTPYVWQNELRTEIVTPGTGKTRSYDQEGNLLWWFEGMSGITIATPYADNGLLYITSGFVASPQRPIYAIRPGGKGDITLAEGAVSSEHIAWCQPMAAPYNPSTLVYQGRLHVLYDRGMVACYDAKTGAEIYGRQRIPGGGNFTASPWAYDGKVFCLSEAGTTFVARAGDTLEVLHTNALADDDMALATPAMAGDRLLLRTAPRLYCIRAEGNK